MAVGFTRTAEADCTQRNRLTGPPPRAAGPRSPSLAAPRKPDRTYRSFDRTGSWRFGSASGRPSTRAGGLLRLDQGKGGSGPTPTAPPLRPPHPKDRPARLWAPRVSSRLAACVRATASAAETARTTRDPGRRPQRERGPAALFGGLLEPTATAVKARGLAAAKGRSRRGERRRGRVDGRLDRQRPQRGLARQCRPDRADWPRPGRASGQRPRPTPG